MSGIPRRQRVGRKERKHRRLISSQHQCGWHHTPSLTSPSHTFYLHNNQIVVGCGISYIIFNSNFYYLFTVISRLLADLALWPLAEVAMQRMQHELSTVWTSFTVCLLEWMWVKLRKTKICSIARVRPATWTIKTRITSRKLQVASSECFRLKRFLAVILPIRIASSTHHVNVR